MFGRLTGRSMAGSAPDRASAASHPDPSLNPGGGMVGGNDTTSVTLADINGDGLPDLVWSDGQVSLNAGYSFLPREPWGCGKAHLGAYLSGSASASASFSLGKYSIGGGRSFGLSDNWTKQQLIDVVRDHRAGLGQIHGAHRCTVETVRRQQHFKRWALRVLVETAFFDVDVAVGLKVDRKYTSAQ